jgi:hypothetical protein
MPAESPTDAQLNGGEVQSDDAATQLYARLAVYRSRMSPAMRSGACGTRAE